jgi:hypothetical protein
MNPGGEADLLLNFHKINYKNILLEILFLHLVSGNIWKNTVFWDVTVCSLVDN